VNKQHEKTSEAKERKTEANASTGENGLPVRREDAAKRITKTKK
jgi:hypothetical protein